MSDTNLNNEYLRFIKYLDRKKKRKNMDIVEMTQFINHINNDFHLNRYYLQSYVGMINGYNYDFIKHSLDFQTQKNTNSEFIDFTNILSPNTQNTQNKLTPNKIQNPFSFFTPEKITENEIKEKKKVTIDITFSGLDDLVKLVEKYEYKEDEEYNINLKLLKDIEVELKQLNNMIGMQSLKDSIANQLLYFLQELHITEKNDNGKRVIDHEYKHTVISGPPGTGKTEIAQIIGKMYSKIGILSKNTFKKVTRNDLVAGYLGQTALKTKAVIEECLGGVLFIDEVYSLANMTKSELDSYSKECIDTLNECLSNYKENLMVIVAGYEEDNKYFFEANKGLYSRFIWRFKIDNYNPNELYNIFIKKVNETDWKIDNQVYKSGDKPSESTMQINGKWFEKHKELFEFFGRDMELLFTYTKIAHSQRIFGKSLDMKKIITVEDINNGLELFKANRKKEDDRDKNIREILCSMYI